MYQALNEGTKAESKMAALRLLVEFGSAAQKSNAFKEIQKIAYGTKCKKSSDEYKSDEKVDDTEEEDNSESGSESE
jgi:hypothetical protein